MPNGQNDGNEKPGANWFQRNPSATVAAIAASVIALLGLTITLSTIVANAATTNRITEYVEKNKGRFTGPAGPQGPTGPAGPQGSQGRAGQNGRNGHDAVSSIEVPIGTIIAWHKTAVARQAPPEGWAECNGPEARDDPDTPFDETQIPLLNESPVSQGGPNGLFLRGSKRSGDLQANESLRGGHEAHEGPFTLPFTPHEEQAQVMSVVWLIRVK